MSHAKEVKPGTAFDRREKDIEKKGPVIRTETIRCMSNFGRRKLNWPSESPPWLYQICFHIVSSPTYRMLGQWWFMDLQKNPKNSTHKL